jgi:N-acetylmuramoyl-L-alanine amidase
MLASAVMSGVRGYFESTPPRGTWFAAQAARKSGTGVASATGAVATDATPIADISQNSARMDMHRVGRGESLGSIARQYGVSVGALKNANQMDSNSVNAGAVLTIPAS